MATVDHGFSGGSSYHMSSTNSGQGNWNTGGSPTSSGSFSHGYVGYGDPRYDVAPERTGNLMHDAMTHAAWSSKVQARDASLNGQQRQEERPAQQPAAIPIPRPKPVIPTIVHPPEFLPPLPPPLSTWPPFTVPPPAVHPMREPPLPVTAHPPGGIPYTNPPIYTPNSSPFPIPPHSVNPPQGAAPGSPPGDLRPLRGYSASTLSPPDLFSHLQELIGGMRGGVGGNSSGPAGGGGGGGAW